MTEFEQRYAELDEEFHEEYHPSHGGNMTRMVIEKLIILEAENEQLRKIEDAARLVVGDEGNPTDAWCLLLNALGVE